MTAKHWKDPIDIFVICFESTPALERCLESIHKCTNTIEHRIIVVEGERSAAENRNIALSQVASPWFVMMDDDVIVTQGWLDMLLTFVDVRVGQIQPKLLLPSGKVFAAEKVFTTPWGDNTVIGMGEEDQGQFNYVRIAELLSGTCCLYNAKILDSCSFDTNYEGAQWEDCDFSMQIVRSGYYLLYCGKATAYHQNLFRRPKIKNFIYFKDKWFGKRELIRRGVLYVGLACDLNCIFCYYRHEQRKMFKPLQELEQECDKFRKFYGNTHLDITGGEPTIYPKIVELVEHCRNIGLAPTIITHGQRLSKEFIEKLNHAGIEDFLVSYHGLEKEHDILVKKVGGYSAMRLGIENIINAGIRFRINTVVTKINYRSLPILTRELAGIKPCGVNFIMFNPWETWLLHPLEDFHVRYSDAAPYLIDAISILDSAGIQAYVSYLPLCLFKSLEKYVLNFPQYCFNNEWGWDFKHGHRLRGEYDYLYYALMESRARYDQGPPCQKCSLRLICSGLPKQYAQTSGWDELRPQGGMIVRDPIHFNTQKATAMPAPFDEQPPSLDLIENLGTVYPWLRGSDPLILHQVVPIEDIKPLCNRRHLWIRNTARASVDIAGVLGGRWLTRKLPQPMQNWVSALLERIVA